MKNKPLIYKGWALARRCILAFAFIFFLTLIPTVLVSYHLLGASRFSTGEVLIHHVVAWVLILLTLLTAYAFQRR